jgi:hypothetical protein
MVNWIKCKLMWCVICVAVAYVRFKIWCEESLLYKFCIYLRIYIVVDFIYSFYTLPSKYNERYSTNFYYTCIYLVFLVVIFFLLNKFLTALKEDKNENGT